MDTAGTPPTPPTPTREPVTADQVRAAIANLLCGDPEHFRPADILLVFLAQREMERWRIERSMAREIDCSCTPSSGGQDRPFTPWETHEPTCPLRVAWEYGQGIRS